MSAVTTVIDLSLVPKRMNLHLYAGDGAVVKLTFVQAGAPMDMSDGVMAAQIRANRLDTAPAAILAVDDTQANQGIMTLTLTGDQTAALLADFNTQRYRYGYRGSWDVQWTPTGLQPVTLFQGDCYCDADVTR